MQIQPRNTSYYLPAKVNQPIKTENLLDLLKYVDGSEEEDAKKNKSKIEVRHENGYVRQYLVKPNGQRVLLMETKQSHDNKEASHLHTMPHNLFKQPFEKPTSDPILSILNAKDNIAKYRYGI
ncbi:MULTISPECIES: hypothetical protein [unclassified Lysinibacillus]|uniref:hypothetical protein n=1 Tax=unclassified Lysinibacillus TaxID=2636778 RepID=UPI0007385A78|nr:MULTISPECIES: hypothetical protein [unclassified Lysinibacillus]KUF31209.1 hypothetical protein AK833_15825 [Lysinibacillus sp. F5]WCH49331.1 hypothetical protein NV349_08115 [Lysinibacillus sp. OF-1]